jgi:hypothetical protein
MSVATPTGPRTKVFLSYAYELHNQRRPAHVVHDPCGNVMLHAVSGCNTKSTLLGALVGRLLRFGLGGNVQMALAVQNGADEVVGWNSDSIIGAIRRWALPETNSIFRLIASLIIRADALMHFIEPNMPNG